MPSFIVISSKKVTDFDNEARSVLESCKFSEVHAGTYMGTAAASSVSTQLKNLSSYKKYKSVANIKIYSGTLTG
ncbi:hypothetical protein [Vibrio parahaemolyticus]|nr:hypothetical protein [Vibrio parahaemolyticus]KYX62048.1 hypothetical protein AU403_23880 [Vibrio parahaemolyticus]KYZ28882.1 hypothetical protein AW041_21470 [Vibrio parahaemolyticus]TOF03699.1 hypothetical protein CGJ31_22160 [Vibrio parahaemolyticus]TOJ94482.1 hypothetical protein CGI27_24410 [Vibrio parahaemolyticus]